MVGAHRVDQGLVDRHVADAVADRVDPCRGSDLRAGKRDGVRDHGHVLPVRGAYDGRQRRLVHAVQIATPTVAPAIGEDLDDVGAITQRFFDSARRSAGSRDLDREPAAPAIFGAVAAGHAEANRKSQMRRDDLSRCDHRADRRDHLARDREIRRAGHPGEQIAGIGLAEIVGTGERRRPEMRVQIVQAGQQRQPARVDHPGAARRAHPRRNRNDAITTQQHVGDDGGCAGAVEDAGAADQRRLRIDRGLAAE